MPYRLFGTLLASVASLFSLSLECFRSFLFPWNGAVDGRPGPFGARPLRLWLGPMPIIVCYTSVRTVLVIEIGSSFSLRYGGRGKHKPGSQVEARQKDRTVRRLPVVSLVSSPPKGTYHHGGPAGETELSCTAGAQQTSLASKNGMEQSQTSLVVVVVVMRRRQYLDKLFCSACTKLEQIILCQCRCPIRSNPSSPFAAFSRLRREGVLLQNMTTLTMTSTTTTTTS